MHNKEMYENGFWIQTRHVCVCSLVRIVGADVWQRENRTRAEQQQQQQRDKAGLLIRSHRHRTHTQMWACIVHGVLLHLIMAHIVPSFVLISVGYGAIHARVGTRTQTNSPRIIHYGFQLDASWWGPQACVLLWFLLSKSVWGVAYGLGVTKSRRKRQFTGSAWPRLRRELCWEIIILIWCSFILLVSLSWAREVFVLCVVYYIWLWIVAKTDIVILVCHGCLWCTDCIY